MGGRFIVNETFSTDDGTEYVSGGIYEIDEKTSPLIERWVAEGKVRDPDVDPDDPERAIDEAKARHEDDDNGDDDDDDDLTPEEIDEQIEEDDKDKPA
jgi:hypothetical protein